MTVTDARPRLGPNHKKTGNKGHWDTTHTGAPPRPRRETGRVTSPTRSPGPSATPRTSFPRMGWDPEEPRRSPYHGSDRDFYPILLTRWFHPRHPSRSLRDGPRPRDSRPARDPVESGSPGRSGEDPRTWRNPFFLVWNYPDPTPTRTP